MLGYFCRPCQLYFREADLLKNKLCPECKKTTEPRLILCGQVMGGQGLFDDRTERKAEREND